MFRRFQTGIPDSGNPYCPALLRRPVSRAPECSKEFEKLPILENIEILRNIIYSGVWYRYEKVRAERESIEKEQAKGNE